MKAIALLLGTLAALGAASHSAWAGRAIPQPPRGYVLDEPSMVPDEARAGLGRLLAEHQRVTGEQIVIAVFRSLDGEDLVDYTARVFKEWKIGQGAKNNGVLLALYWEDRKARIEVGYGLEPQLTDARSKQVLDDSLIPYLKDGQPGTALQAATLQILSILDSPLISNNQAKALLGAARQEMIRSRPDSGSRGNAWLILIIFGLVILINVLDRLRNPETCYTSTGWRRVGRRNTWVNWGGGDGGFTGGGSGGGFSGGGGRSGGGGASGSW